MKSLLVYGLVLGLVVVLLAALAIHQMRGRIGPKDALFNGRITVLPKAAAPGPDAPEQLKVLTWNIHYGVGPEDDQNDRRTPEQVLENLQQIAQAIEHNNPDIVLLQEVDFKADRSGGVDQLEWLQKATRFPYAASIVTWNPRYVPFPYQDPKNWIGQVTSGQAVLSRFPLKQNRRRVLPQPTKNPFWYNWFYLHRSIQEVDVQISTERWMKVYNLHLEAFDGTNRQAQSRIVSQHVEEHLKSGQGMILGGDLNALPPEATAHHGFMDEPDLDYRFDDTIKHVRSLGLQEAGAGVDGSQLTFPAKSPNRRLDYLYASHSWILISGGVVTQREPASDHLPVAMVLSARGSESSVSPNENAPVASESMPVGPVQIRAPEPVKPERLTGPVPKQGLPPRPSR